MCGILGTYDPGRIVPDSFAFSAALERLRRRGPDDAGTWHDACVALGHRRLAVVDLSPAGHQPMVSADRRYVIVFNGEIYNHLELRRHLDPPGGWSGQSDTETLLEAYRTWGPACLQRLNGMFAFGIWDREERRLFLARDRLGVKPVYVGEHGGRFAFGSRPGAVAQVLGRESLDMDPDALRVFLELGYIPAPLSFHRGIRKLPPAHYALIDARGQRVVRYWDFRCIAPDESMRSRSEGEILDEFETLLHDAVRVRLMSDVPLGAFLSGGVDSALVVSAMKAVGVERPRTFTINFREAAFDEGPAAAFAARQLGVDHVHETVTVDGLLDLLPVYLEEYDEPFTDSSAFPTMALARLARRHVTVALTGDGADEIFGGYHYYPLIERLAPTLGWPAAARAVASTIARAVPAHRARLLAGALRQTDVAALFNFLRGIGKDYEPLLESGVIATTTSSTDWYAQFAASFATDLSAADTAMRLDAGFTLPELFLQKVDVATMAFSLEARCPMTDYRLVEWAMRLPLSYKLRGASGKHLLKRALAKRLPESHVQRPKMGFGVPIAQWLRGPLAEWAREIVHDDAVLSRLPLDRRRVRALLEEQRTGRNERHPLLWSVLMLLWFTRVHGGRAGASSEARREVA